MSLRVYNTLTGTKEVFEPVRPGKVGIYLCGPTVYKSPHIGHMVGPVIFDAIKRYLVYKGYAVTWIVNITDIEDKLIDASQKTGLSVNELAEKYGGEYHECLSALGVDTIDRFPNASEHLDEIIEMCQTLIARGHAYASDGNVWFDVTKDPDYGKLSHRRPEDQESGTRDLAGSGKRSPADFALWKAAKPGEPQWESPFGAGRPGWHIECSAMSMKYLGETLDMHGGGMDLLFPHHENELAQSESATGKPFAKFWLHNGLTRLNTKKISGSDAATAEGAAARAAVAAKKLIAEHGPELLRYMLLSTHYRRPIEFTNDVLVAARKGISTFFRLFERIERLGIQFSNSATKQPELSDISVDLLEGENAGFAREVMAFKMKFLEMMDDDFNTAGAIGVLHELASAINGSIEQTKVEKEKQADVLRAVGAATQTLRNLGGLLGLFRGKLEVTNESPAAADGTLDRVMQLLITLRNEARQTKNFALADSIRKGLAEIGITLEDRADGTGWRKG
ncbi:cysteine--tRNA ligase [soil metagenome]